MRPPARVAALLVLAPVFVSLPLGCESDYWKNFGIDPVKSERTAKRGTPLRASETYMHAAAVGDRETLMAGYADKVAVIRGTALLREDMGALGGEDGDTKTQIVTPEQLKDAYLRARDRMGETDWNRRKNRVLSYERRFIGVNDTRARIIREEFPTKPNDQVMLVRPTGPIMLYLFREDPERGWLVVAEYWTE